MQPVRPLGSTAKLAGQETAGSGADNGRDGGADEGTTSIPRALLLALVERWRQRPITAQKRLEVAKERAKARQVKESRNHDIKETRQQAPPPKPDSKKPAPDVKKAPSGGPSGKDAKPAPKAPPAKQPPVNKPPVNKAPTPPPVKKPEASKKPEPAPKKPEPLRKQPPPDSRKAPAPPQKPEPPRKAPQAPLRKGPEDRKAKPERPSGPEGARKKQPEPLRKGPEGARKEQVSDRKTRNDRPELLRKGLEKSGGRPEPARKIPEPRKNGPEGLRKPTPVLWKAPPEARKEKPEPRKETKEAGIRKAPPGTPPKVVRPVDTQKGGRPWKELPGHRPPAPQAPKASPKGATAIKTKPEETKGGATVTATLDRQEVKPIEVTSVDAKGVTLGAGASKPYLTRGEVRSMKQFERRLTARAVQMSAVAERTKGLQAHAQAQATRARQLAEKTRGVKGGRTLLPVLDRLADQAERQASLAEGIHLRATRAADLARAVLADVKKRDGLIYQAVVDSPETQPAEMAFYKGN